MKNKDLRACAVRAYDPSCGSEPLYGRGGGLPDTYLWLVCIETAAGGIAPIGGSALFAGNVCRSAGDVR